MVKHWRVHWREKLLLVAEPQRELGKKMPCKLTVFCLIIVVRNKGKNNPY